MQTLWEFMYWMGDQDARAIKTKRKFVISGCLQAEIYQLFTHLLRNPTTNIILATRDYADRAYSVYKYFCSPNIDKQCIAGHHAQPQVHFRRPMMFHKMILHLENSTSSTRDSSLVHHVTQQDWEMRTTFFRDNVGVYTSPRSDCTSPPMLVVAMESLNQHPKAFWYKATRDFLHLKPISNYFFEAVRWISKRHINKGNVMTRLPMRNDTRAILDQAWFEDCLWASRATGYDYPACHPSKQ
jgi:hypothetical protein